MGYIYTEITSTTFDGFIVELEEKTGIVVKKTDTTTSSSNIWNNLTIQFPGKEEVSGAKLSFYYSTGSSYSTKRVFADTDNELLILKSLTTESAFYLTKEKMYLFLTCTIKVQDGEIHFKDYVGSTETICDAFNIANTKKHDAMLTNIVIYPVYDTDGFHIDNLYLNSQRVFLCGLVLEDDNGDRYFTLGSYFLYKIN